MHNISSVQLVSNDHTVANHSGGFFIIFGSNKSHSNSDVVLEFKSLASSGGDDGGCSFIGLLDNNGVFSSLGFDIDLLIYMSFYFTTYYCYYY